MSLKKKLKGTPTCLALPDVFVDHLLYFESFRELEGLLTRSMRSGRARCKQDIRLGGNAFNFGYHFSKLGGQSYLFANTSKAVFNMISDAVKGLAFSTKYVKTGFEPALTVALEPSNTREPNININHPGSLEDIGPEHFPGELCGSNFDLIGLFNWANTRRAAELFSYVLENVGGTSMLDLASPQLLGDRLAEVKRFLNRVHLLVANESEIVYLGVKLGYTAREEPEITAEEISKTGLTVAVHSSEGSMEARKGDCIFVKTRRVKPLFRTGAGDAWTAAYAYALLNGFETRKRLGYANRYATNYVVGKDFGHRRTVNRA
ncbi:MAG: PfkB family carbohydrate kinase [Thermoprotei archaeon]